MNKKAACLYFKGALLFASAFLMMLIFTSFSAKAGDDSGKLKTVVIDPGHGGEDPGALGSRSKEKDIVLGIGLKLGALINENQKDVKVIFTRNTDVFIPLHERADIANRNNADLFISIHANANKNHTIYGVETYSMGLHTNEKNMEVAKKENAVITLEKDYTTHYEGYDPNSSESFIIFSLIQNTYMEQSLEFANFVQNRVEKNTDRLNRGVRQAGFLVLWKTTMPSVLIETGFITNANEEKFLTSLEGQQYIADAIFKAFQSYKNKIESNSNFSTKQVAIFENDSDNILDPASETISDTDSVYYAVQLSSTSKKITKTNTTFKKCKSLKGNTAISEYYQNKIYKYTIGRSEQYNEIVNFSKEVKKYYPKAFVVAIKNGKIIPLTEAIKKDK